MRIVVRVKPRSSQPRIKKIDEGQYRVWVRSAPEKGKANEEMMKALADYFKVTKSSVRIVLGKTAREKLVEIIKYKKKK